MYPEDKQRQSRPTQLQLAAELGVSQVTVHKALAGAEDISEERRRQVLGLAEKHGYRVNAAASTMRSGRHHCISLLHSTDQYRSQLPAAMLNGICDTLGKHDLKLNVSQMPDTVIASEGMLPRTLREWGSDGLLINYQKNLPPGFADLIESYRAPTVWINYDLDIDCVRPDDFQAGYDATRHLLKSGRKKIFYVCYTYRADNWHYSEIERRDGYVQAMLEAGLPPVAVDYRHPKLGREEDPETWLQALRSENRPDGIVAYGHREVSRIVRAMNWLHLESPEDIAFVSFGEGTAVVSGYPMPVWQIPDYKVGCAAVEVLLRRIKNPAAAQETRKIAFGEPLGPK